MRFYDKLLEPPKKGFVSHKAYEWLSETRYYSKSSYHINFQRMRHSADTPNHTVFPMVASDSSVGL